MFLVGIAQAPPRPDLKEYKPQRVVIKFSLESIRAATVIGIMVFSLWIIDIRPFCVFIRAILAVIKAHNVRLAEVEVFPLIWCCAEE